MLVSFANPFLLCPLQFPKRNRQVKFQNFFLTFTDAILCVIQEYKVKKTDIILMPNFYCPSTLKIISHHFTVKFYKINNDFSVDKEDYFSKIREFKPRFILNYCYLGFKLNQDETSRLKTLCGEKTVIIDDWAHKILYDSDFSFINENHFYIDSCRKHSSFLGSHLVHPTFRPSPKHVKRFNWYKIQLTFLQYIKGILSFLSVVLSSKFLFQIRERVFLCSDSISGTSSHPTKGNLIDYLLYMCLNFRKLRAHNSEITRHYHQTFSSLKSPFFKTLDPTVISGAEPNYYPLLMDRIHQDGFLKILHKNNIFAERLWESEELPDDFRQEMNLYLYDALVIFPITWMVRKKHIDRIGLIIRKNFKPVF